MTTRRFPRLSAGDAWYWGPLLFMCGGVALLGLWVEEWHPHPSSFPMIGIFGLLLARIGWDVLTKWVSYVLSEDGVQIRRWGKVLAEVPWQDYQGWRWLRASEDVSGDIELLGFGTRDAPRAILIQRRSGAPPLEIRFGYCGLAGKVRSGLVVPQRRYRRFLEALREVEPTPGAGWSETSDT